MRYDRNIVVAVDFDNTLTRGSTYQKTGELDRRAVKWLERLQALGVRTVLWTTRENGDLEEAERILAMAGVAFDFVNEYPFRNGGRKVNADAYIDDKANDGKIRWFRTYLRIRRLKRSRDAG